MRERMFQTMKRGCSATKMLWILVICFVGLGQYSPVLAHGNPLGGLLDGVHGTVNGLLNAPGNLVNNLQGQLLNGAVNGAVNSAANRAARSELVGAQAAASQFSGLNGHPDGLAGLGSGLAGLTSGLVNGLVGQNGVVGNAARSVGNLLDTATGAAGGLLAGQAASHGLNTLGARAGLLGNPALNGGIGEPNLGDAVGAGAALVGQAAGAALAGAPRLGLGNAFGSGLRQELAAGSAIQDAATAGAALGAASQALHPAGVLSSSAGAAAAETAVATTAATQVARRQNLATDALSNAQAEAAMAGADMVAHGANNARSASLAGNAYRQAKLAGARDRVNIAGTVQNSARISDAAIATHDAATKAEDSLLGSELAVDSAATVLDSDAAYIPPVTNSLLRSLPYGRLGLRNIVPKPLTYPSSLLPDVWLNGYPVNYLNVPLRMLPYGLGTTQATNRLHLANSALGDAPVINGQPFYSNNGMLINGMVADPTVAYLTNNMNGILGSSILPVLANGQLEAQDEVAMAHMLSLQQQTGAGMLGTYNGYGRNNPVPLLTGSVSAANLVPTTTIGTTYPVGSALVIEPRDSYFQDYIDNASSRQNFDEHQQ